VWVCVGVDGHTDYIIEGALVRVVQGGQMGAPV
jgi:hypothetical protein